MKKSFIIALVMLVVSTVNINAQDKKDATQDVKKVDRVALQVEQLTTQLNLNAKQVSKVTAIYTDAEAKLNESKAKLVMLRKSKAELKSGDQEAVDKFNSDYKAATSERKATLTERKKALLLILDDDQKAVFEAPKDRNSPKNAPESAPKGK